MNDTLAMAAILSEMFDSDRPRARRVKTWNWDTSKKPTGKSDSYKSEQKARRKKKQNRKKRKGY